MSTLKKNGRFDESDEVIEMFLSTLDNEWFNLVELKDRIQDLMKGSEELIDKSQCLEWLNLLGARYKNYSQLVFMIMCLADYHVSSKYKKRVGIDKETNGRHFLFVVEF